MGYNTLDGIICDVGAGCEVEHPQMFVDAVGDERLELVAFALGEKVGSGGLVAESNGGGECEISDQLAH